LTTNPARIYECVAAGEPVIIVDLPEITQFGKFVSCAQSRNDFVLQIGNLIKQFSEVSVCKSADSRFFASEQTWHHRGEELLKVVETIKMLRISVNILTFNNLDLAKACLESIRNRGHYSNLEVIVVDNVSSDGAPAYFSVLACERSDLRITHNPENLGFAAARGDFQILLNNGTLRLRYKY
jgi:hypothetical protein